MLEWFVCFLEEIRRTLVNFKHNMNWHKDKRSRESFKHRNFGAKLRAGRLHYLHPLHRCILTPKTHSTPRSELEILCKSSQQPSRGLFGMLSIQNTLLGLMGVIKVTNERSRGANYSVMLKVLEMNKFGVKN